MNRIRLRANQNYDYSHPEILEEEKSKGNLNLNRVTKKGLDPLKKSSSNFFITVKDLADKKRFENLILYSCRNQENQKYEDDAIVLRPGFSSQNEFFFQTGLYVGRLYIDDFIVDIEANNGEVLFQRMLNYANNIFVDKNTRAAEQEETTFPLLEYLFLLTLQKASILGFPQEYKKEKYHDLRIHGGIDINNFINKDIPFTGRISSQKNERHYIQCIIDVLYFALFSCKHDKILEERFPRMSFIASELKAAYSGHRPDTRTIINAKNHKALNNPMFAAFKKVLQYAEIIIRNQGLVNSEQSTRNKISGYLLDISELWEIYLEKLLVQNFPDWNIRPQTKIQLYHNTFFARSNYPDIVMEKGNDVIILDAKYKYMNFRDKDVDRTDLFQIHSYAGYYKEKGKNVILCGLLYPLQEKSIDKKYHSTLYGLSDSKTKFMINGIYSPKTKDSSEARKEIEKSEIEFINQIKELLI